MLAVLNGQNNLNHTRAINQPNLLSVSNIMASNFRGNNLKQLSADKFEHNSNAISFGSNATQNEFSVTAMAPLKIKTDVEMAKFENDLQYAKEKGVKSISVDVWWGMVQKDGLDKFDWSYYENIFKKITDKGLDVVPILSTHQCGSNIGDDVHIPLPDDAWNYLSKNLGIDSRITENDSEITKSIKMKLKDDLYYKNERGQKISEVIPIWYDEIMMPKYRAFTEGFKKHFIDNPDPNINIKNHVKEMHVSCGAASELRYPTYGENLKDAGFPTRGMFVGYDMGGKTAFRKYIEKKYDGNIGKLNYEWNTNLESFDDVFPPHNNSQKEGRAKNFVEAKNYENTKYGKDFMEFYHNTLLKHGEDSLTMAHEVFKDTDIGIGIKIPGIHWQMNNLNTPRIAERIAGILDGDSNDFGYKSLFDMIKSVKDKYKNDTITSFTCLEMDNDLKGVTNGKDINSSAKSLVSWVLNVAKERGLTIKGENACEGKLGEENAWNLLKHSSWEGYDGVTFLRVGALKNNSVHFENFMNWVKYELLKKGKEVLAKAA